MNRESQYWRSSPERYGRYWGQQQRPSVEVGEWQMGLESKFNGHTLKVQYLKNTDEVTGLSKVLQVKVLGRTIRFLGESLEFAEGVIQALVLEPRLVSKPDTIGELALFLTEVQQTQNNQENILAAMNGRGKVRMIEPEPAKVVIGAVEGLMDKGKLDSILGERVISYCGRKSMVVSSTEMVPA